MQQGQYVVSLTYLETAVTISSIFYESSNQPLQSQCTVKLLGRTPGTQAACVPHQCRAAATSGAGRPRDQPAGEGGGGGSTALSSTCRTVVSALLCCSLSSSSSLAGAVMCRVAAM